MTIEELSERVVAIEASLKLAGVPLCERQQGPSREWLRKMADAEDAAGCVSVGGGIATETAVGNLLTAAKQARSVLDSLLGDTDPPESQQDRDPVFAACQSLSNAIAAVEEIAQ